MVHGSMCADLIHGGDDGDKAGIVATVLSLQNTVAEVREELRFLREWVNLPAGAFGSITIKSIKSIVCSNFGFSEKQLTSRDRRGGLVRARHIAAHLCCRLTKHSLGTIADNLGYGDHSVVCHARDVIAGHRLRDPGFDEVLTRLETELRHKTKKTVPTKR